MRRQGAEEAARSPRHLYAWYEVLEVRVVRLLGAVGSEAVARVARDGARILRQEQRKPLEIERRDRAAVECGADRHLDPRQLVVARHLEPLLL